MVNRNLFASIRGKLARAADARNLAGGPACALSAEEALAQVAATGCLHGTFYASDEEQLGAVLALASETDAEMVAKTAVWARERGLMKDAPALLVASLASRAPDVFRRAFPRVVDDARTLRTFVQIVRSGTTGRRSLGSLPRRMVRDWLASRTDEQIFRASAGSSPSLADVVRMVHPKPETASRRALYGWLVGRKVAEADLPDVVRRYEDFRRGRSREVPDAPLVMLASLGLGAEGWRRVARDAGWQTTRSHLNTFARHGVFDDAQGEPGEGTAMARLVADRIRDREAMARARVLPYQVFAAWKACSKAVPAVVRAALLDAAEAATASVPAIPGRVVVCPDVSGSMSSPVTGRRGASTSSVRCIDVAALIAAAVLRRNPDARVIPFEQDVVDVQVRADAPILATAKALASIGGGGTDCSAPVRKLVHERARADLVILVSDNESWVEGRRGRGTALLAEWDEFRDRNPGAKLVCIDLQPNSTTQAHDRPDVLNVGGFSDGVFEIVAAFAAGSEGPADRVSRIRQVVL